MPVNQVQKQTSRLLPMRAPTIRSKAANGAQDQSRFHLAVAMISWHSGRLLALSFSPGVILRPDRNRNAEDAAALPVAPELTTSACERVQRISTAKAGFEGRHSDRR